MSRADWQLVTGRLRVAAIDCGTNSIRLLVADMDLDGAPRLVEVLRRLEIVRLGQGVDATGEFAPEALERTFAACRSYAREIERLAVDRVRFIATSASRDVGNRDVFAAGVQALVGTFPEVVSGDLEAQLSFSGATRELRPETHPPPYLVVDIGGGSTELVSGFPGAAEALAARSVDIGCVRLTERHLRSDPPTVQEVAAARADIDAALTLAAATVPLDRPATLIGLAGSVTTVAALALGLPTYDAQRIHHSRIPALEVSGVAARLLGMSRADRAALPVMHPGRVDVIGAGALILDAVVERTGATEVLVSEHDILDGIAWSVAP